MVRRRKEVRPYVESEDLEELGLTHVGSKWTGGIWYSNEAAFMIFVQSYLAY